MAKKSSIATELGSPPGVVVRCTGTRNSGKAYMEERVARAMAKNERSPGGRASMRAKAKTDPSLGREIQTKIGQQLRSMYDDVVKQGVPDRFVNLLGRLDKDGDKQ
jgi:Anti-sigma factor NepR